MSEAPSPPPQIRADRETQQLLRSLCGERAQSATALDTLLARAVWSRLAEPGDAAAGVLVAELGPIHALDLIAGPGSARAISRVLGARESGQESLTSRQISAGLKRWRPRLDRSATLRDLAAARASGMELVTPEHPNWPDQLGALGPHEPQALWVRGAVSAIGGPALAVVGARACTSYGSHVTADLAGEACGAGFTIVSGAAYGVDAVAHRTALALDAPTVAVLAGGADRPYPASHDQLLARVAERGAICSELVPGAAPTRWRFLQRNRIIAALSGAVLVTEAGMRSGTLNTAGHAAELGRALGAVPGPITSAASAGCHRLVREYGAALITNGRELLELLGVEADAPLADEEQVQGPERGAGRSPSLHIRILDALPLTGGRSAEETAVRAGVSAAQAAETLAELELLRYVSRSEYADDGTPLWRLLRRK